MCGIAGVIDPQASVPETTPCLERMVRSIRHRGPDEQGFHVSPSWGGVGACRLSIIDPDHGHQPITNEDRSVWLVFNGEIYNFRELRADLVRKGHTFTSRSDGEVIVHLYEERGIRAVEDLRGMFAFALMDQRDRSLYLVRDRLGKKPLFYHHDGDLLVFASEAKALFEHPRVRAQVDPSALHYFLAFGYTPAPHSMFRGVSKLMPAHILKFSKGRTELSRYWEPRIQVVDRTPREHEDVIVQALRESVRLRMISDVPLGVFLSGGIDSTIVTSLASEESGEPLNTFSIDFEEQKYSESRYARAAAKQYGTIHHKETVRASALDILPQLVWHYDEPFGDSSAIPTFYLARMASRHVKTALSGDGGDELFGGYQKRYLMMLLVARMKKRSRMTIDAVRMLSQWTRRFELGTRWRRAQHVLEIMDRPLSEIYRDLMSVYDCRYTDVLRGDLRSGGNGHGAEFAAHLDGKEAGDIVNALCLTDLNTYLLNDILVKVDIASMAHSLEVRSPFLDHKVVEAAFTIPGNLKLTTMASKRILKRAFRDRLPRTILKRGKQGFGIPLKKWLAEELKPMCMDLLTSRRFAERGYFDVKKINGMLKQHFTGRADHTERLWLLLLLELWHRMYIDGPSPRMSSGVKEFKS